ncbi:MAG: hypothetical protein AAFV90_11950 [Cyanobacteria bacterium J06634_5]
MTHNHFHGLPLKSIEVGLVAEDIRLSQPLVKPSVESVMTAQCIDYAALTAADRRMSEAGDVLPVWAYRWLTLTAQIVYGEGFGPCTALVVPARSPKSLSQSLLSALPGSVNANWEVQSLSVDEMCVAIAQASNRLGFIIVWGLQPQSINSPRFPLDCHGFILPIVDGMGMLCAASEADRTKLNLV